MGDTNQREELLKMTPQDGRIRGAIIGCGVISDSHLKAYQSTGIELAALCDSDRTKAEAKKAIYGNDQTQVFTDYKELLAGDSLDLVTIATPVAFHCPMTVDALVSGKHVACEKPSTLSTMENREICDAAKAAGKKVVFFSSRMRWGPARCARAYIEDGDLGEIYRVHVEYYRSRGRPGVDILKEASWFANSKFSGGGILMDMGQYFMDMVLNLVHWPEIETVSATTFQGFPHDLAPGVVYDVEEHCSFFARATGMTLTFDFANIANQRSGKRITIFGTKGGIRIDDQDYFTFITEKGGPWQHMEHKPLLQDKTGGNEHVYQELQQAIRGNDPGIGTTPEEALRLTQLTEMVYLSAREGREVRPGDLN